MVNLFHKNSTICAISTPQGLGAIALIRLSGKNVFDILKHSLKKELKNQPSHTAHFGLFRNKNGEIIDEVVVTIFKAPNSFTGEDIAEIACHGSPYIQQQILNRLIDTGAVLASPGEFTLRAFLNGKLDLSQADAVADLIHSTSSAAHQIALKQMRGGFSNDLRQLREKLINFASLIELELDFSEEDVEFADRSELNKLIEEVNNYLQNLIESFKLGNAIKNGINTAIIGRPNAGKSTLLNALLNENRAIVSDIAGTTRDTIEEVLTINGIDFRFIDTAGIRETTDEIEKIGVQKALEQTEKSAIYIYLFDANNLSVDDVKNDLKKLPADKQRILAANKSDLIDDAKKNALKQAFDDIIFISAKNNDAVNLLKTKLVEQLQLDRINTNQTIVTNARHYSALKNAKEALQQAKKGLENGIPGDLLAMDIREALNQLGSITGEISTDDLLGNIFSKFCIGK